MPAVDAFVREAMLPKIIGDVVKTIRGDLPYGTIGLYCGFTKVMKSMGEPRCYYKVFFPDDHEYGGRIFLMTVGEIELVPFSTEENKVRCAAAMLAWSEA